MTVLPYSEKFCWILFLLFLLRRASQRKFNYENLDIRIVAMDSIGYYDDVLRHTTKIRPQKLIPK